MKVQIAAVQTGLGLIAVLLGVNCLQRRSASGRLTRYFRFGIRNGAYTTLLMSTGLTFGTISALFGLTHGYTDRAGVYHSYIAQDQYSILVTVVIASAIVPTMVAQKFFRPEIRPAVALEIVPREAAVRVEDYSVMIVK